MYLLVALTALVLAGCSTGPATISERSSTPTATTDARSADRTEALRTKFAFLEGDPCAQDDPAAAFPRCGRFITEIRNTIPQVRRDAPAAGARAGSTEAALDRFTAAGCEGNPGTLGGGDPARCGPALAQVQREVRALATAVAGR